MCVCVNGQQVYNGRCVNSVTQPQIVTVPGKILVLLTNLYWFLAAPGESCLAENVVCTGKILE